MSLISVPDLNELSIHAKKLRSGQLISLNNVQGLRNVESIDDTFQATQLILRAVLDTAFAVAIPAIHRGHACHAFSTLLEACSVSSDSGLRRLSGPDYFWQDALKVYLERSETCKMKSMKKFFMTLVLVISTDPNAEARHVFVGATSKRLVSMVFRQEKYGGVRPALHALDVLISKKLVSLESLYYEVSIYLQPRNKALLGDEQLDSGAMQEELLDSMKKLISAIVTWLPEPEIAPVAGSLLSNLYLIQPDDEWGAQVRSHMLVAWNQPLLECIETSPEVLENFKQHVLRRIFGSGVETAVQFMNGLGLPALLADNTPLTLTPDTLILLSALDVCKSLGYIKDLGMCLNFQKF
jgi:hypothetical protein